MLIPGSYDDVQVGASAICARETATGEFLCFGDRYWGNLGYTSPYIDAENYVTEDWSSLVQPGFGPLGDVNQDSLGCAVREVVQTFECTP